MLKLYRHTAIDEKKKELFFQDFIFNAQELKDRLTVLLSLTKLSLNVLRHYYDCEEKFYKKMFRLCEINKTISNIDVNIWNCELHISYLESKQHYDNKQVTNYNNELWKIKLELFQMIRTRKNMWN